MRGGWTRNPIETRLVNPISWSRRSACVCVDGERRPRSGSIVAHGGSPAVGQAPFALACVGSAGALLHPPAVEQLLQMPCEGGVGDLVAGGDGQTAKQRRVSYPPEVADPPELVQQGVLAGQLAAGRGGSAGGVCPVFGRGIYLTTSS